MLKNKKIALGLSLGAIFIIGLHFVPVKSVKQCSGLASEKDTAITTNFRLVLGQYTAFNNATNKVYPICSAAVGAPVEMTTFKLFIL